MLTRKVINRRKYYDFIDFMGGFDRSFLFWFCEDFEPLKFTIDKSVV